MDTNTLSDIWFENIFSEPWSQLPCLDLCFSYILSMIKSHQLSFWNRLRFQPLLTILSANPLVQFLIHLTWVNVSFFINDLAAPLPPPWGSPGNLQYAKCIPFLFALELLSYPKEVLKLFLRVNPTALPTSPTSLTCSIPPILASLVCVGSAHPSETSARRTLSADRSFLLYFPRGSLPVVSCVRCTPFLYPTYVSS